MHQTSELYQRLLRDPGHRKEYKCNIAGVDYGQVSILSLETSGGVFSKPDIGNCASRQIDLRLRRPGTIPRSACIRVFVRLVKDIDPATATSSGRAGSDYAQPLDAAVAQSTVSEWIPKGVFFISTRQLDKVSGVLDIHGFDAMRRAGEVWDIDPYANWPMSQQEAVADIARQMGVEVDPRTVLSNNFPVGYPVDENGDLAMQDVLEGIAVCNAGNWVITDEGKLLLLRLGDIPPETFYLVTEYGRPITFGGVKILVG